MSEKNFEVIVVGGGPAGLSAALILGRMRREVLLLDTDAPANAVSGAMHGFLAQDGVPPADVRRIAEGQLDPYGCVERRVIAAESAREVSDGFEVVLEDGTAVTAGRLLLAHGMSYGLPELDGASELWGKSIFHCPYCHGWEVRDKPIAVYATGEKAIHQALLLASLTGEIVVIAAGVELSSEGRERLDALGIAIVDDRVERVEPGQGTVRVVYASERADLERFALFIQPDLALASEIAASLGATIAENGSVQTDAAGLTSRPGLYVAGDAGAQVQSVAIATGSGARAAYAINAEIALEQADAQITNREEATDVA